MYILKGAHTFVRSKLLIRSFIGRFVRLHQAFLFVRLAIQRNVTHSHGSKRLPHFSVQDMSLGIRFTCYRCRCDGLRKAAKKLVISIFGSRTKTVEESSTQGTILIRYESSAVLVLVVLI